MDDKLKFYYLQK